MERQYRTSNGETVRVERIIGGSCKMDCVPTSQRNYIIFSDRDKVYYATIGNRGQEIKGKEGFSVSSFKLALRLLNSINEA